MFVGRAAAVAAALAAAILLSQGALYAWLATRGYPMGPAFAVGVLVTLAAVGAVVAAFKAVARRTIRARVAELAEFTDGLSGEGVRDGRRLAPRGDEFDDVAHGLNRLADRLELAQKQLEVERRARAKAQDTARVADRLASVGKVASSIAHDLGTPLNVVSGQAELLLMRADEGSPVAKSATAIHEQALHMRDIIDNVLGFARKRRTSQAIGAEHLRPVVEQAATLLHDLAEEAAVRLTVEVDPGTRALVDSSSLVQAITNLGSNAIRACATGGHVRLLADYAQPGDDDPAELDRERRWVAVRVIDDGVGMDDDQLRRIFQPFYSTATDEGGTGLGLAITTEVANALGGALSVCSEPGAGSTFTLWVPATR